MDRPHTSNPFKAEGGCIDIEIAAEDLEILYTEGKIQVLDKQKRVITMTVIEADTPKTIMWCESCNKPANDCKEILTHNWIPKEVQT